MNKTLNEAAHRTTHLRRLHCYLKQKNPLRLNSADNSFCHNSCSQTKQHAWFQEREQSISAQGKVCPVTLFKLTHHRPANFSSYCFAMQFLGYLLGGEGGGHPTCCCYNTVFVVLCFCWTVHMKTDPSSKSLGLDSPQAFFSLFFLRGWGCFISPTSQ